MKRLLAAIAGLAIALVGSMAVAAWVSTGSATATATATDLERANPPSVTRGAGSVGLSWTASTLGSGAPVGGYRVYRHHGSDEPVEVCLTTATTCTDFAPLATAVSYGVVATVGTNWRGPESELTPFTYDDAAPSTTASVSPSPNGAGWNQALSVTVTLASTEIGTPSAGVDHISYAIDGGSTQTLAGASGSFPVAGAGTHVVTFSAVDNAGNAEVEQHLAVKIDPDAPVTTVTPDPVPAWSNSDVTLSFSATDSGSSGIKSVTVDGTPTIGATASATVSDEGTNTVHYFATDNADNVEGTKSVVVRIDKTAPTASISPASDTTEWRTTTSATINAADALSGPAGVSYKLNGAATFTTTSGSSATVTGLVQGTNTIVYRAIDVAGNESADQTATIKVDTVLPTASLTQTAGGQPTISGTDATSGIASVSWRDGGSDPYTTVNATSTTLSLSPGTHTIWYFVTDNAGNASTPVSQGVTVGAPPAAPALTGCAGPNGSKPYTISWSWGPGNPNGGFKLYYADLSSGSIAPSTFGAGDRSGTTPDINSLSGTFKLVAIVNGVESAPATATFVANGGKTCTIH